MPIALLDAAEDGLPVVWVNDAFERVTGYGVGGGPTAAGRGRRGLGRAADVGRDPGRDRGRAGGLADADAAPRRRSRLTCRAVLSPVREADGTITHWVVALQDLTEQLTHDAEQAALVEAERRERRSLGLIAQVSDLLMDVDDPHALREIAAILRRAVVGWAQFYLDDGGLRPTDGIVSGQVLTGRGRGTATCCGRAGTTPSSCCSTARTTGRSTWRSTTRTRLGSASAWLSRHVVEQLDALAADDDHAPLPQDGPSSSRCPGVGACSGCSSCWSSEGCAGSSRRRGRSWS